MVEDGVPVTLYLPKSLVDQLQREAFRRGFTLSQYVRRILSSSLTGEGAKPEERVTASGASSAPIADQPERRRPAATQAVAAGKQPPRSWRFCPECLALFDGGATCPYDGSELVPFDTEEGKQLYMKLKNERKAGGRPG
jgi:hypothetical protein